MTGVLALFTRCEQKKSEAERRGEKTIQVKNLLQTPGGTLWLRVQVELQRFLAYLSGTRRARTLLARAYAHAAMHVRIRIPETVIPLHLLATQKPPSPHCVQPSPIIPFGTGCTATKAEKLGSCVDDRATNLFGGTHYMSSLYSSAAERGELNMDMQRWVSL